MNRSSLGQLISTAVFYGVALIIFLHGMEFLENGILNHALFSFLCSFLCFMAGMRFAVARIINKLRKLIYEKNRK